MWPVDGAEQLAPFDLMAVRRFSSYADAYDGSPQRVFRARASAGLHTRTCMTLLAWLKLRGMLSSVKEAPPVSGRLLAGVLDERMNGSRSSSGSHADLPLRSAPHPHSHIHISRIHSSRIHISQPPQTHERTNTAAPLAEHRVCVCVCSAASSPEPEL